MEVADRSGLKVPVCVPLTVSRRVAGAWAGGGAGGAVGVAAARRADGDLVRARHDSERPAIGAGQVCRSRGTSTGLEDHWLTTVMIIEVSRACCTNMPANGTRCPRIAGAEKGSPRHLRAFQYGGAAPQNVGRDAYRYAT